MDKLSIIDILLDYLNEQGTYQDMLNWYEMHGNDKEELDEVIEGRYDDL